MNSFTYLFSVAGLDASIANTMLLNVDASKQNDKEYADLSRMSIRLYPIFFQSFNLLSIHFA